MEQEGREHKLRSERPLPTIFVVGGRVLWGYPGIEGKWFGNLQLPKSSHAASPPYALAPFPSRPPSFSCYNLTCTELLGGAPASRGSGHTAIDTRRPDAVWAGDWLGGLPRFGLGGRLVLLGGRGGGGGGRAALCSSCLQSAKATQLARGRCRLCKCRCRSRRRCRHDACVHLGGCILTVPSAVLVRRRPRPLWMDGLHGPRHLPPPCRYRRWPRRGARRRRCPSSARGVRGCTRHHRRASRCGG